MSLNLGWVGLFTTELFTLECSHWLWMGKMVSPSFLSYYVSNLELRALEQWKKWCLQLFSVTFDLIFVKLAGNEDRHESSNKFEFGPDRIIHFGVICPWVRNFSPHRLIMEKMMSPLFSSPVIWRPHSLKIFFSETTGPVKVKFHMEPPWDRGTKVQTVLVTWPRWPPCPYMVKTLKKSSSPEPKGRWPWNLVCSIGCSSTTKFVQMMSLGWPWPILQQVKFGPLCFCMGKR